MSLLSLIFISSQNIQSIKEYVLYVLRGEKHKREQKYIFGLILTKVDYKTLTEPTLGG